MKPVACASFTALHSSLAAVALLGSAAEASPLCAASFGTSFSDALRYVVGP